MNYRATRNYLLSLPEAREDYPFGPDVAVYKIQDKMFATLGEEDGIARSNLKCDPDQALGLRDIFPAVQPGYHMNKKHWNTVILDGSVPEGELRRMIDLSYTLVVKGLKKSLREGLIARWGTPAIYRVD